MKIPPNKAISINKKGSILDIILYTGFSLFLYFIFDLKWEVLVICLGFGFPVYAAWLHQLYEDYQYYQLKRSVKRK